MSVAVARPTVAHGTNTDIDTSAEVLTSDATLLFRGLTLKTPLTNTGIVYVGGSTVTADGSATDGIPLSAGESLSLDVDQPNRVYVIASANNQKLSWIGM